MASRPRSKGSFKTGDVLKVLGRMADEWGGLAEAMTSLTVGMVMLKQEVTSVEFPIDSLDLMVRDYQINRVYEERDGKTFVRYELTPREKDSG